MSRVLSIILVILLFVGFFEIGLFSSYTIATSEVPDIKGLIDLQINTITGFFSPENVNKALIKDPDKVSISNKQEAALKMEEVSQVDGINLESINITTYDDKGNSEINVTIEALGYSAPNSTSGQIIISQEPSYKVIAKAVAKYREGKFRIDTDTVVVESILKLY